MSSIFCACSGTLKNTGTPNSQRVIKDGNKLILVPLQDSNGVRNSIPDNAVIDDAYITDKINNSDPLARWYPVGDFRNVEDVRADPITESFTDGSSDVTQQGVRTFTGWLVGFSSAYVGILESWICDKFGLYTVDECGDLVGVLSKDCTELYPIRVNERSFYADLIKQSDTLSGKVQLRFEFAQTERDSALRMIEASEMTADLTLIQGLVDVDVTLSSPSTTGLVADLQLKYDTFIDHPEVTGWLLADFELYNETTSSTVVITSVTEAPDGTYTLVFPAQTSADVLRLSSAKNGFAFEETIAIP